MGTPIGNLGDISPRALEALESCDFIAAEDTRVTMKLLNHFGIRKPLISYYEHNKRMKGEVITARLLEGENCVLVTDAGMPAISDPGENIVDKCHTLGIHVTCVPGPSAVVTALAVSGMPSGRFTFEGFLSVNKKSRREHLLEIRDEKRTMIFYEAPHKLPAMLTDMLDALGDRRIAMVRHRGRAAIRQRGGLYARTGGGDGAFADRRRNVPQRGGKAGGKGDGTEEGRYL